MRSLILIGGAALLIAGAAPARAAADPEADQLLCDLAGQCGTGDDATPSPPAAAPAGGPRRGDTRGFTFKRTAPTAGPTVATPAAVPAVPRLVAPTRIGVANLRLNFASGSATLDAADKARLAKLAQVLSGPALASRRARIEGHTDSSGSARANLDLSRRRAQAAADYLVGAGVAPGRLDVLGLGSTQPLAGVAGDSPLNRRVLAVILD